jgi:AraC-like DNA-binding protein
MIHYSDELPKVNYSDYISEKMSYGYNYLTNIFSDVKGITIQHFIILHKIKKIKELLIYDELNITNLSQRLHYSSVVHFSNQFIKSYRTNPYLFWQV